MNNVRARFDVRVIMGIAGLALMCGSALAQNSESTPTKNEKVVQPADSVGGLLVPADGEVVVSKRPPALGYITDLLWIGRLSEQSLFKVLQREVRKMKHSPPTPAELQITESTSETIEQMFADHRELLRKYNNEHKERMVALRKAGGFDKSAAIPSLDADDPNFSPLMYLNPGLVYPSGVGRDAIKVAELTQEQHDAREALRALILAGPTTDDIEIQILAALEANQQEALQKTIRTIVAMRLKAQAANEKTKRTGRMDFEDLPLRTQELANSMEPRQRAAYLEKIRMNKISGGTIRVKAHQENVIKHTQKRMAERAEQGKRRKEEQEKQTNPDEG